MTIYRYPECVKISVRLAMPTHSTHLDLDAYKRQSHVAWTSLSHLIRVAERHAYLSHAVALQQPM
jgi:hypothetical protein